MDYQIVSCTNPRKLEDLVKHHIKNGWRPQGGIEILNYYGKSHIHQAMIKEKTNG